jgi:hypothetical protein
MVPQYEFLIETKIYQALSRLQILWFLERDGGRYENELAF